ncbi:MAG: DUF4397 domain-containing protein [Phycisphaerales bacterium]|nr:DUF4397 domain-containing protein [Phycisphaerales bacterium]MCB9856435.1 DUF4397 domain-containing protein [Phycisphaerales bacterium]
MSGKLKSSQLALAAACLMAAAATGCDQTLGDYIVIPGFPGFELSNVRVVNTSPDIGEVDVWNRAYPFFQNLDNGDASPYTHINDGVRKFAVVPTDAVDDSAPLVEADLKYPVDTYHTVLIVGTTGSYQLIRFDDDRTPTIADGVRFRVIHAVENGPSIRVFGPGDEALSAEFAYMHATGSVEYGGALSDLTIRRTDTDAVLWTGDDVASGIAANKNYTLIVFADANDAIHVLVLENVLSAM